MIKESQTDGTVSRRTRSRRLMVRCAILALLIAVAGLSTLAKNSLYYPKSHPTHYVSIASKARVAQAPAALDREPLIPVARVVPPQPVVQTAPHGQPETLPIPEIGVVVSRQHRSPPISLS